MANFETSQIRLPNNDLLILKDTTARTAAATAQTTAETAQATADSKVTIVSWDATNKKLTKTINGSTTDIVAGSTILSGLTKAQVTSALGYTPPTEDTNTTYSLTQDSTDKHKFTLSGTDGSSVTVTIPDNNITYTFAEGNTNGAFTVTPSDGSAKTVKIHGLGNAAYKGVTTSVTSGSTDLVTSGAVASAISTAVDNLPEPMIFKGTLGTNGTITALPTASSANEGFTYKVITPSTYSGQSAKLGDMFICAELTSGNYSWIYVPSGDDVEDTWRNIKVNGTEKLGTGISSGAIDFVNGNGTTVSFDASGNKLSISHADTSSQASVNNSGRTYIQDITLDTYGHVTGVTSATETVVDTNTTYTIGTSGNNITLTPSSGSAQSITAPYATKALNNKDGESITATYRRLDDPYYDTVYATEEEVGDIIVTGAARFLNTINGSISGNAATATNVAWSGVTGKPTTLGGYGITDAKIANGVITLGSNTITPLTSHQTVSNKGATLAWATTSTIATIGGTDIKVTMPSNPNTNTTYTLGADTTNNKITLTPSSGNVQSITAPYATSAGSAGSATKATQDESGNNIKASYASSISISDHTITLKNKNGVSLGTVTVPDNDHYAWGDITGKPSTFPPSVHTHNAIVTEGDYRTIATTPNSYNNNLVFKGLKSKATIDSPSSDVYSYLVGLRGWADSTGGDSHELAFNNTGIYWRHGATTTWGSWVKLFTTIDTYTGTLTKSQVTTALGYTPPTSDTNTHRPIQMNDTEILGNNTTALNLKAGTNVSLSNSSGTVTITSTDTKNTAGSTNTSSKIYLIGATSQAANPQTYSQDTAYVGTDGCVYSGGNKVEVVSNNAGYHNSVYRGKSLGTSITEAQWAAISAGTFDDLYIGDYWTLSTTFGSTTSNVQYVIAGFDYWWNCGDSYPQSSNKHHVVLVPASHLYTVQMNATNVTTGGYIGSAMYTTNLANARTGISNLFGDHLYSVRRLFTNSVNASGQATGWAWATSSVDLMNENMVYGSSVWTTSGFEVGVDRTILPLFALNPASASIRGSWWLRSVATAAFFACVSYGGYANYYAASYSIGVRPAFAIY